VVKARACLHCFTLLRAVGGLGCRSLSGMASRGSVKAWTRASELNGVNFQCLVLHTLHMNLETPDS